MKRILTQNNSVVLQEIQSDNSITIQLGYELGGVTYKIENNNVKFYLKDDYFYKNCIFSADLPLNIDGTEYDEEHIAEALGYMFPTNGGSGGGNVTSVNGKTGAVRLTANDVNAYNKSEIDGFLNTVEENISDIELELQGIEADIDALESASDNYLVASNIKAGTNIAVSVNNNDVTISTVGIPTVEGLAELEEQVDANTTAIEGIQEEITGREHFRGYFATNAEIQALTATDGDFAFSAESGTKWVYNNNAWTDTHTAVPDKTVEKSTTVPLMDGTATIGASNKYAAADHIHPTDTTRASQSDFTALETQVQANTIAIGNKANQSDLNTLSNSLATKQDKLTAGSGINIDSNNVISATGGSVTQIQTDWNQTDSTAVDYIKNKPTIPTVPTNVSAFTNDAGYLTQHQSLANYYTKTESDNKFALKFTDVDDIQLVNSLPANPDSKTLYLIPVQ